MSAEAETYHTHWFYRIRPLSILAGVIALLAGIPLLFVLIEGLSLPFADWVKLWDHRLPELLWNTLSLSALVAIVCFILGVSTAWIVTRREFFGRRVAIWLLVLPMAIPTYVFAHIYTHLSQDDGWLGSSWKFIFSDLVPIPNIYNMGGVVLILSLATFPYVFLLVRSAMQNSNRNLEEAARIHGYTAFQVFWKVNIPLLRPAIAAGLAFVVLHVLSDFGAVSMLRYQTFTLAIYNQMDGRFNYQTAAGLSLVLVGLSITFFLVDRFFRQRQRFFSMGGQIRRTKLRQASRGELILIWLWIGLISLHAFILPLLWLIAWSWRSLWQHGIGAELWSYTANSIIVAFFAAIVATLVALPIALYHKKHNNLLSQFYLQLSSVGFVLPGPVVALGILSFVLLQLPFIYGGFLVLIMALVVRFLPLAIQTEEAAIQQLTPNIEQAARSLGANAYESLRHIVLPLLRGGLSSAWVLVFIDALKELPATLLLRPVGFDTLAVRIWIEASEEMLELAAPAALLLIIGTLPAIWIIMIKQQQHQHSP